MSEKPKPTIRPGFLPMLRDLYGGEDAETSLARGAAIALAVERRRSRVQFALNAAYYSVVGFALAWLFSLAIDRDAPVRFVAREIINPGRRVHAGDQVLVRATRTRHRQCELTKRHSVIDGSGRRTDFEPERFDAYGPITDRPDTDVTGPIVPLDAVPGRGRLMTVFAWDCNALQRALGWSIVLIPPPLEFEILPREGRGP